MGTVEEFRKSQEETSKLRQGGYWKELVLLHWDLYKEYLNVGFNEEQALKLVIEIFGAKGSSKE